MDIFKELQEAMGEAQQVGPVGGEPATPGQPLAPQPSRRLSQPRPTDVRRKSGAVVRRVEGVRRPPPPVARRRPAVSSRERARQDKARQRKQRTARSAQKRQVQSQVEPVPQAAPGQGDDFQPTEDPCLVSGSTKTAAEVTATPVRIDFNPAKIREAVILSELLAPPPGLRDDW